MQRKTTTGRPSLIHDKRVIERLLAAIRAGSSREGAAQAAGIHRDTLQAWLRRGRQAVAAAGVELAEAGNSEEAGIPEPDRPFVDLARQLSEAESADRVGAYASFKMAADVGDWRAAAKALERRYPEDYGKQFAVDRMLLARIEELAIAHNMDVEEALEGAREILAEARRSLRRGG